MDMSDKDKLEPEKRNDEPLNYNHQGLPCDWRYTGASFANSSMGLASNVNGVADCGAAVGPSCSSSGMVDSFVWEHSVNPASSGFSEMNAHNGGLGNSDPLLMLKGGMLLPSISGMLPHSLSQFPADSAFIERAARFSSFSGGHFGELLNPFGMQQPVNPYLRSGIMMPGPQETLSRDALKPLPGRQTQKSDVNMTESSKDVSLPPENEAVERVSPREAAIQRSDDETKHGVSVSGYDSDEPGFSGGGIQEGGTPKGLSAKKRRRGNQDSETEQSNGGQQRSGEVGKKNSESEWKEEKNPRAGNKSSGIHGKQSSQNSDPAKDEYIHVRARRGQATNSHSLAERVRREKISERMKFLQDLVPGCSKVTGKAVMLDEIINYVQSLQRQVEFLSMKLATVNPRLEFNIERFLAKDNMFSARAGPSGLAITSDIPLAYPSLLPGQPTMMQPSVPGMGNCSDVLRRTINSQLTDMGAYKEPIPQLPNAWEDELHNVVQMGFNANAPLDNQETNCSLRQEQPKAEP